MKYQTTLNEIRKHGPCKGGWEKLLKHLGKTKADDEALDLLTILDSNGLDDMLWCLRALPESDDNAVRLLVCDLVKPALEYTQDKRAHKAVEVARDYANGKASEEELIAASDAASDAAWAAARSAARSADRAADRAADRVARAAARAAWNAARAAASDAASYAAWATAWATAFATSDAAWYAAWATAWAEQEKIVREWLS